MIRTTRIHPLHVRSLTYRTRRHRRSRLPLVVLTFILGLLAGWVLRGGGASLP